MTRLADSYGVVIPVVVVYKLSLPFKKMCVSVTEHRNGVCTQTEVGESFRTQIFCNQRVKYSPQEPPAIAILQYCTDNTNTVFY